MNYFMIIIAVLAIIGNIYQYTTKNNICKASLSGFHSCVCSDVGINAQVALQKEAASALWSINGTVPSMDNTRLIPVGVSGAGNHLVFTKGQFH